MEEEEIMDVRDGGVASEIDPFNHPTPGQSLTQEAGRPFEGPAETNDPEQVIAKIIAFFENPEEKDILISTLISGMPVEAIVQTFALGGVAEGKFSADVAELIKPAVGVYLMKVAADNDIAPELVVPKPKESVDESTFFEILKERNPQLYSTMLEAMNEQERMGTVSLEQPQQNVEPQNFLNMGEV